jgi:hypothetical protein
MNARDGKQRKGEGRAGRFLGFIEGYEEQSGRMLAEH